MTEWGEEHNKMFWKDANCKNTPNLINPPKFEGQGGAQKCKEKCIELRDGQSNPCIGYTFAKSGNCYLKSVDTAVKLCKVETTNSARLKQGINRLNNVKDHPICIALVFILGTMVYVQRSRSAVMSPTKAPEEDARLVLPAVPMDAKSAYWVAV